MDQEWLRIKMSVGAMTMSNISAAQLLAALVQSDSIVMSLGCPVDPTSASASADLVVEFAQDQNKKWAMKTVDVTI
jgi:hypothetical protein